MPVDWYWWALIVVGVVVLLAVLQRFGLVDFRGTGRRGSGVGGRLRHEL